MIDLDLERELAPLVDTAPEAPPFARVHDRVRTRRRRRIGAVAVGVFVLVGTSVAVTAALVASRHHSPTIATTPTSAIVPAPVSVPVDTLHVTTPTGTSMTLTAAPELGLAHLPVTFNAQITSAVLVPEFPGQRIVVQDVSAPTPRTCWSGYTYGHWRLLLQCGSDAELRRIHDLLGGAVNTDGFLVFHPNPLLIVGPVDSPEVELGDDAIGIFGADTYPSGCPTAAQVTTHTADGLGAQVDKESGAWWCDPAQLTRVHVGDPALIAGALKSLRVRVDGHTLVTSLYGTTLDVDAPGFALGDPLFDASVQADVDPFAGSPTVGVSKEELPAHASGAATYTSADGHELYVAPSGLGQPELFGTWDGWRVDVLVDGLSDADRARLASLLRFHVDNGFLVLDPVAPLHLVGSVGTEIIFHGLMLDSSSYPAGCPQPGNSIEKTAQGFSVGARFGRGGLFWCDPIQRVLVQTTDGAPGDAAIRRVRVTRVG